MTVQKWRKILYEDQNVPDNYVDASFLYELKRNLHIRNYEYSTLLVESGIITQQLCSVCLFVVSFLYMEEKRLSPQLLVLMTSLLTAILYITHHALLLLDSQKSRTEYYLADLKTAVLFSGLSFVLSPVLVSLTETISTDTIYAMTTAMLLANLAFHDYTAAPDVVPGALSLNAAIFASVCLASRLHTPLHAFATVTFSFELFALWPVLRRRIQNVLSVRNQVLMTAVMNILTFCVLVSITAVGAALHLLLFAFITFACPAWLRSLQPYKNNLHGPWDEAEIKAEPVAGFT